MSEERADENPKDFWDDELEIAGGDIVIRDKDGQVVTTLKITGENLERWLIDADVEKVDSDSDSGSGEDADS